MYPISTSKGYKIPIENNEKHMRKLTLYSETENIVPGPKPKILCYKRSEKFLYLPRYYCIENIGNSKKTTLHIPTNINVSFEGKLRDYQQEVVEKTIENFESGPKGGIWSLYTGGGKTSCALYMITKMKVKTIIIVHKQILLDQWKERIKQFIPNATIGIIQGPILDIDNKDIVIAMVQSLTRKEYPKNIFKTFGFLIVDEVHTICSRTFSEALFMIQTEYRLGLSATPKRKDGFDKIFYYHLGPTIISLHKIILKPNIKFFFTETIIPVLMTSFGKMNLPRFITDLSKDDERNTFIIDIIHDTIKDTSRKMLVFSDRVEQCEKLNKLFYLDNKKSDTFIGKMKKEEKDKALTCDVIFATYGICKEGFDCPELDTLLFATPKSDVIQAVGRILRKKNENEPLVIDIIDKQLKGQWYCRKKFYNTFKN